MLTGEVTTPLKKIPPTANCQQVEGGEHLTALHPWSHSKLEHSIIGKEKMGSKRSHSTEVGVLGGPQPWEAGTREF